MIKSNKEFKNKKIRITNKLFQKITIGGKEIEPRKFRIYDKVTDQMLSLQKKGFIAIRKV